MKINKLFLFFIIIHSCPYLHSSLLVWERHRSLEVVAQPAAQLAAVQVQQAGRELCVECGQVYFDSKVQVNVKYFQ